MKYTCPSCGTHTECGDFLAGFAIFCRNCHQSIRLPSRQEVEEARLADEREQLEKQTRKSEEAAATGRIAAEILPRTVGAAPAANVDAPLIEEFSKTESVQSDGTNLPTTPSDLVQNTRLKSPPDSGGGRMETEPMKATPSIQSLAKPASPAPSLAVPEIASTQTSTTALPESSPEQKKNRVRWPWYAGGGIAGVCLVIGLALNLNRFLSKPNQPDEKPASRAEMKPEKETSAESKADIASLVGEWQFRPNGEGVINLTFDPDGKNCGVYVLRPAALMMADEGLVLVGNALVRRDSARTASIGPLGDVDYQLNLSEDGKSLEMSGTRRGAKLRFVLTRKTEGPIAKKEAGAIKEKTAVQEGLDRRNLLAALVAKGDSALEKKERDAAISAYEFADTFGADKATIKNKLAAARKLKGDNFLPLGNRFDGTRAMLNMPVKLFGAWPPTTTSEMDVAALQILLEEKLVGDLTWGESARSNVGHPASGVFMATPTMKIDDVMKLAGTPDEKRTDEPSGNAVYDYGRIRLIADKAGKVVAVYCRP